MKPDQKYMPSFRKSYDGDIKFKPFAPTSPLNLSPIALIPMLSFNDSFINNDIFPQELKDRLRANGSNNKTDDSKENNNNSINKNSFTFPDNFQIETLYSYNKGKKESSKPSDNTNQNNSEDTRIMPNVLLKDFDLNLDEDVDLFRNCCNSEISNVYNYILNENPGIITLLESYNIPKPMIKLIVRRIIKLTLDYSSEK